jgi:hypothetical protein
VTGFFTFLLRPFENGHAFAGIVFISVITGAVMLLLFRLTSNQQAMKEVKTKISAYFLEMRLYKEDISAVMASQRRILVANMHYMKLAVVPAIVMIIPVILIMVQLNLRYAEISLVPGDTAIIKVKVEDGVDVMLEGFRLSAGAGIEKVSPAVRISSLGEVDWKIRLAETGMHDLTLSSSTGEMAIPVFGTSRLVPLYRSFRKSSFWETVLNPGSPRIPDALPIESIEIKYPAMAFSFGFISLSWLWTFLIISMAFGLVLKFLFGVE